MTTGWSALDVLQGAGPARDECFATLGAPIDDVDLIRGVLAETGLRDDDRPSPQALARHCQILRALDALIDGRIERAEFANALAVHRRATNDFVRFAAARADLRTLAELCDPEAPAPPERVLARIHGWLCDALVEWLVGSNPERLVVSATHRDPWEQLRATPSPDIAAIGADFVASAASALERDRDVAVGARREGWSATPIALTRIDDDPQMLMRMGAVGDGCWIMDRAPVRPWIVSGLTLRMVASERRAYRLSVDSLHSLPHRDWPAVAVSLDATCMLVECSEYIVAAGVTASIERVIDSSIPDARAQFREHIEQFHEIDDPPPLLAAALRLYLHPRRVPPLELL